MLHEKKQQVIVAGKRRLEGTAVMEMVQVRIETDCGMGIGMSQQANDALVRYSLGLQRYIYNSVGPMRWLVPPAPVVNRLEGSKEERVSFNILPMANHLQFSNLPVEGFLSYLSNHYRV